MMSLFSKLFHKPLLHFALFASMALSLAYLPQITLAQQPENDFTKATDILAQVNAWRIENGLWPLTVNPTLDALALAQASYVFPFLDTIQDEDQYHYDAQRRNPRDRAAAAGWPLYDTNPQHIEYGENAGVGSAKFVMNFWHNSPIHAKAALSKTYREVGVAALPIKGGGYFYMMDFGARPGVLPIVLSTDGKSLWLTDENSRYAKVKGGTKVRLLDLSGNPLTDVIGWSPSLTLPDGVSADSVQVLYINGANEVKSSLRGPFTSGPAAVPTAVAPVPTATPGVAAVNPTTVPSTRAPDATATVPAAAPTAAPVQAVNPAQADIILTYDANGLFLRNNTKNTLDISGLSIIGSNVTIGTPLWAKLSDFPTAAFPASHCLAAELSTADVPVPSNCKWTRSIINLTSAKLFWTLGDFIVSYNGTQIAACKPSDGQCVIDLP